MSTPEQITLSRLGEYSALIEIEGYQRRTQRFASGTIETDEAAARKRRARLDELVTLLADDEHRLDVEKSVEGWIDRHPLNMTGTGMKRVIDQTSSKGNGVSVAVQIGDPTASGRYYPLLEGQFAVKNGLLLLTLPDSVAEEFRQQGRRALQREIVAALGM